MGESTAIHIIKLPPPPEPKEKRPLNNAVIKRRLEKAEKAYFWSFRNKRTTYTCLEYLFNLLAWCSFHNVEMPEWMEFEMTVLERVHYKALEEQIKDFSPDDANLIRKDFYQRLYWQASPQI